jgi:hypothetical protein
MSFKNLEMKSSKRSKQFGVSASKSLNKNRIDDEKNWKT